MTCKLVETECQSVSKICGGSLLHCFGGALVAIETYYDGRESFTVDAGDE